MFYAWLNKNGQWLHFSERHTHTGKHVDIDFVSDINNASVTQGLKFPRNIEINIETLMPVKVEVVSTRTVTVLIGV